MSEKKKKRLNLLLQEELHNACVKEGIKGKRLTKVTFLLQLTQFLSIKDFKRFPMFLMCGSEIFVKPQGRDFDFPSAHFRSSYFFSGRRWKALLGTSGC